MSALIFAACFPTLARGQSLETALSAVYESNPVLEAERANLRATDEKLPQALANWRPTVTVTVDQGVADSNPSSGASSSPPPGYTNALGVAPQQYGVTLAEPLYRGGRTQAQKSQALNLIRAERGQLLVTEQTVLLAAAKDYLDVVLAGTTLDLDQNFEKLMFNELDQARSKMSAGELTQTDVAQAEAAYANAVAQTQTAQGNLNAANAAFQHDIGLHPGKLHQPEAVPVLPASRDGAIEQAGSNNPSVTAAGFKVAAQRDDIRLVRGSLLPTVTLNANINQARSTSNAYSQADTKEIYATLTVPLYDGGTTYSQSREAQQTMSQLLYQYDEAHRLAVLSASQSWDQMQSQKASIRALGTAIAADRLSLDGIRSEQVVGARTELDVLNAEQTLFQAETSLVQAKHDEMLSEFTLKVAVGEMTIDALGVRSTAYDPDRNLAVVRDKWVGFGTGEDRAKPRAVEPKLPHTGYYDVGAPVAHADVTPDIVGMRQYMEAEPVAAVRPLPRAEPVDTAAAAAALKDYDHDLTPRPTPNRWMDSSDP